MKFCQKTIFAVLLCLLMPSLSWAILVHDPDTIEIQSLVSFGEDGAAWLNYRGHEMLVTSGYMIGSDLRVVAIRHDSVVLYRPKSKQYHVLVPRGPLAYKDRNHVIWTTPLPIWMITRMVGLAYRKDYICNWETGAQNKVRRHVRNMESMMRLVVDPNHRFYGRDGIIYVAPKHVHGKGWKHIMRRIQNFRTRTLGEWYSNLNENGTIISNGKPLDQALQTIAYKSGVRLIWEAPVRIPLYCSLRDRPWHEILSVVLLTNCLEPFPTPDGIVIR